jgi:hypothetical protein
MPKQQINVIKPKIFKPGTYIKKKKRTQNQVLLFRPPNRLTNKVLLINPRKTDIGIVNNIII